MKRSPVPCGRAAPNACDYAAPAFAGKPAPTGGAVRGVQRETVDRPQGNEAVGAGLPAKRAAVPRLASRIDELA
jgi:hypothetical protein